MKRFKDKTGKFGSLVSLIALCAMLMLFAANLPVFISSAVGQTFAGVWAAFALVMFAAHVTCLSAERRQRTDITPRLAGPKDARTRKNVRIVRAVRG
ncbi:hypothetical protein SCACP_22670 [Sporomusa carbonis]|uniref:hypothetical protein n=1 Tax=Sporomusa carbonis TaxID=3076075 RepID=UPI003A70FC6B